MYYGQFQHLKAKFDCEVTEGRSEWSNLNIAALTYFCLVYTFTH